MEVLRNTKELSPETMVIILTGYGDMESVVSALRLGADDYLVKPCDIQEINFRVSKCLEKQRLNREFDRQREALRESEERYRNLINNSNDIISTADESANWTFLSPSVKSILGYDPEEMVGKSAFDFMFPEDIPPTREAYETVVEESGKFWEYENRWISKDGRIITLAWNVVALQDKQGNSIGTQGVGRDITEHKQAEEELRESGKRLLKAQRVAGMGFLDWNLKTNEVFLSDEVYSLYGLDPDKALNRTELITKIVHPDNLVYVQNNFDLAVHEGKRYSVEHRTVRPDGKVLWVHAKIQLTCDADGKPETLLGTIVDITGRKRAEEALRESAMKFRTFANFTYDWESWIGPDGKYIYISPSCERTTGYSPDEFIKDPALLENITHPEDRKLVSQHIHDYSEREKVMEIDFRIITRKGDTRWISHVCQPVHDNYGNWLGRRWCNRDITLQREIETQLQHTQKMEAVGTFAGGMAHEFNNLMTAVIGYSSFLLTDLGQDDPIRKDVEEIKKAGNRASSLVKQLLAFSRKQVLKPVMLDLNSLLTDKEEMLLHLFGEDVELKMVLEQDLGQVKADQSQVEQVILNLAVNAKDAMPEGGKLIIETANAELDEFYVSPHSDELKPRPYVMLAMSDTGMGMDKKTQSQIFEPFFTTKDVGEGTGLGLSVVYGVVKQSGGDIRVYSEPEKGTIFKIYLPRMDEGVVSVQEADLQMEGLGGSETVLLVDDNALVRKVSRRVLEQYGYKVLEAEDAHKALMVSEQHQGLIELMVTDVVMPEMSGLELAERLQPLRPEVKVLYMSGYTDKAIDHRILEQGVNFVAKPFSPEGLARKVREVIEQ